MERIAMSLEIGVVVEQEAQPVDLHRREMFADTLIGEAEEPRELAAASLSRVAAIVCLRAIAMPPRNVSVRARATGR